MCNKTDNSETTKDPRGIVNGMTTKYYGTSLRVKLRNENQHLNARCSTALDSFFETTIRRFHIDVYAKAILLKNQVYHRHCQLNEHSLYC